MWLANLDLGNGPPRKEGPSTRAGMCWGEGVSEALEAARPAAEKAEERVRQLLLHGGAPLEKGAAGARVAASEGAQDQ